MKEIRKKRRDLIKQDPVRGSKTLKGKIRWNSKNGDDERREPGL